VNQETREVSAWITAAVCGAFVPHQIVNFALLVRQVAVLNGSEGMKEGPAVGRIRVEAEKLAAGKGRLGVDKLHAHEFFAAPHHLAAPMKRRREHQRETFR
jgi:hypothetical protein